MDTKSHEAFRAFAKGLVLGLVLDVPIVSVFSIPGDMPQPTLPERVIPIDTGRVPAPRGTQ